MENKCQYNYYLNLIKVISIMLQNTYRLEDCPLGYILKDKSTMSLKEQLTKGILQIIKNLPTLFFSYILFCWWLTAD